MGCTCIEWATCATGHRAGLVGRAPSVPESVRADLVDLCKFMLATGERIGEALAVTWKDLDRETGQVDCSYQIQRRRGKVWFAGG